MRIFITLLFAIFIAFSAACGEKEADCKKDADGAKAADVAKSEDSVDLADAATLTDEQKKASCYSGCLGSDASKEECKKTCYGDWSKENKCKACYDKCVKAGKKEADCKAGCCSKKPEADAGASLPDDVSGTNG